jgi:fermentation-respiration switch protein FrsA (DUF1100 family)
MKSSIGKEAVGGQGSEVGKARRWIGPVWRVVRPVLIAYLLVLLAMTFLETWLIYPIPPIDARDWHPAGLNHEEVRFHAADGTKLFGWFVPQANSKRAVLYCHGNGEDVASNAGMLVELRRELDASVFIFDYRGYGYSEGRPSEAGCIADGLAADKWLADRLGLKATDVIVMGRSLGGGIAVAVAAEQGARALVLDSTFSRLVDVAATHYPWLPVRLFMRNRYDSVSRIRQYGGPVFQSHGTADTIVPIEFARQLFAAIPSDQKEFREFPGRDHNDQFPSNYLPEVRAFLDRVVPPPGSIPAATTK